MGWTKRQICEAAFGELALAGYVFDLSPDEMNAALLKLDTKMATWASIDINLGYAFGTSPDDTDLDDESGLPTIAIEAAYKALAIDLAASKGKQLQPSTLVGYKAAYNNLLANVARGQVQQQQYRSGVPAGAGNKPWRSVAEPFIRPPDDSVIQISSNGGIDFLGE